MPRDRIRKRFDQLIRTLLHETLRFLANGCVIHGARDLVAQIPELVVRPERNIEGEALRRTAFFFRHSDVREDFKLLDVNLIIHAIQFGRNPVRSELKAGASRQALGRPKISELLIRVSVEIPKET